MLASSIFGVLRWVSGRVLYYTIHSGCSYIRGIFVLRLGLGLGTLGKRWVFFKWFPEFCFSGLLFWDWFPVLPTVLPFSYKISIFVWSGRSICPYKNALTSGHSVRVQGWIPVLPSRKILAMLFLKYLWFSLVFGVQTLLNIRIGWYPLFTRFTYLQLVKNLPSLSEERIYFFTPDHVVSLVNLLYSVWFRTL